MNLLLSEPNSCEAWPTAQPRLAAADHGTEGRAWHALTRVWLRMCAFATTHFVEGFVIRRQVEKFYLIMSGHIYFETLSAAVEFNLFGLLSKHRRLSCPEIRAPPWNSGKAGSNPTAGLYGARSAP